MALEYTTINHRVRRELGISLNEYALCDMIYHLSVNPKNNAGGWCYMARQGMADEIGLSKQALITMIDRMILAGLVEKHPVTAHLRTLERWYAEYLTDGKETLPMVKKLAQIGKETLPDSGKETLPYINSNNNTIDIKEEERADAPHALTIEGFESDSLNGQKQKVEAKGGGGAKVKKTEVYLTDQFPIFDLFKRAWEVTEYANEHRDIDPRRLWDALSAWQGGKKGEPVYKDWIKAAITWANRSPHEFKYLQNGSSINSATDSVGNQKLRDAAARLAADQSGDLKSKWANLPPR